MQHKIEASLARAVNQLPHLPFDAIASAPVEKMYQHDTVTRQPEKPSMKAAPMRRFAVAFACMVLVFFAGLGGYQENLMVDSYITIDVNPSFEISVNRKHQVLKVKALDKEADAFVEGLTFRGRTVDDAVETLFLQLGESPYLSVEKNTVLISVCSKNADEGSRMEKEVARDIEKALEPVGIKPRIVYQLLDQDTKKRQEAKTYHTSVGKLQMAKAVKAGMQEYSLEQLVAMPMWKLVKLFDEVCPESDSPEGLRDTDELWDDTDDETADQDEDIDEDMDEDMDEDSAHTPSKLIPTHTRPRDEDDIRDGGDDQELSEDNEDKAEDTEVVDAKREPPDISEEGLEESDSAEDTQESQQEESNDSKEPPDAPEDSETSKDETD